MKIEEIGSEGNNRGINTPGSKRGEEIRRMAQSFVAEQQAVHHARQGATNGQNNQSPSSDGDIVKISDEALQKVAARGDAKSLTRTDQILSALRESLDSSTNNPSMQQNKKSPQAQGAQKKKQKVETTTEWQPITQPGKIHEGRAVIGKLKITKEVKEAPDAAQGKGGNNGAQAGGKGSSVAQPQGKNGNASAAAPSKVGNGSAGGSLKDGKRDQEGAAAAQSMKDKGLQVDGLNNMTPSKGQGIEGAGGSGKTQEFDVRRGATGRTQSLTTKSAGKLTGQGPTLLGTFRRLDDKPLLKYVTLDSKNTEEGAQELKKKATAAGESPDAIKQGVSLLRDMSRPDNP